MFPELGRFALILALYFSLVQALSPVWGYYKKNSVYFKLSKMAVIGQFIFLSFAMLSLIICFINNDLTVLYVREHSHDLLPLIYKMGAAWGGHEGSLLLWCLILSAWTLAFSIFSSLFHPDQTELQEKILMVLGIISFGFILFLFATSNPFQRDFPDNVIIGNDLTPILQDPGLIFHPPMLYFGYVGFAIGFAFAIAALIEGKLDKEWAAMCRPWIILPWAFLSLGIVLGSWWAYRELGWGGWWFWDPVENASLLPWLSATALIHTLIVSEKRSVFKGWTILLAIVTFALSLIGTFLVRSGVLVSVHTFASDPTRGIFLLSYLTIIIGGAFLLFAARIKYFYQAPHFKLFSRETFLLVNSIVLLSAVATIVIGTLYPIILDALNAGKISVGEPYFNTVFIPIMLPLLFLMGLAPHMNWGQQSFSDILKKLNFTFFFSLILGFFSPLLLGFEFHLLTGLGLFFGIWIILATIQYAYQIFRTQHKIPLQNWSMIVAHLGIAIFALGITINKSYSTEKQIKIAPQESVQIAGYHILFQNLATSKGPNYKSIQADFLINGTRTLTAEQRLYTAHQEFLSKPGISTNIWRDIYIALGNSISDDSWSVRLYYKPFVRWIWFGGIMLLIGGFMSLLNYLIKRRVVKHEIH